MSVRAALVAMLAERVLALGDEYPLLVGIEGRSAAGKTTLADALASAIETSKRPVLRASIDDFHPPGYAQLAGEHAFTPESYFDRVTTTGGFADTSSRRSKRMASAAAA